MEWSYSIIIIDKSLQNNHIDRNALKTIEKYVDARPQSTTSVFNYEHDAAKRKNGSRKGYWLPRESLQNSTYLLII